MQKYAKNIVIGKHIACRKFSLERETMDLYVFCLILTPIIMTAGLALCLGRLPLFMLLPTIVSIVLGLLTMSAIIGAIAYFVVLAICLIFMVVRFWRENRKPSRK
jgi:Flp pilus assembly protein TadB